MPVWAGRRRRRAAAWLLQVDLDGRRRGRGLVAKEEILRFLADPERCPIIYLEILGMVREPIPDEEGFLVRPGTLVSLPFEKRVFKRLGGKYGDCVDADDKEKDAFTKVYPVQYSQLVSVLSFKRLIS